MTVCGFSDLVQPLPVEAARSFPTPGGSCSVKEGFASTLILRTRLTSLMVLGAGFLLSPEALLTVSPRRCALSWALMGQAT